MEGAITWGQAASLLTFIIVNGGAVVGVWWRLAARVEHVRGVAARDLADFKLEVAKDYLRPAALEKMESRLIASEARMVQSIDDLRASVAEMAKSVAVIAARTERGPSKLSRP